MAWPGGFRQARWLPGSFDCAPTQSRDKFGDMTGGDLPEDDRTSDEASLPEAIRARASILDGEYAWRVEDIPAVILAAQQAKLLSIGGQLQFRSSVGTLECYWVDVDLRLDFKDSLSWPDRIDWAAAEGLKRYARLREEYHFLTEGERANPEFFTDVRRAGEEPADIMWFVWYVARPGAVATALAEAHVATSHQLGSKHFEIFRLPDGQIDAVKLGWSWPAFFLTWIWAFAKGLNQAAFSLLAGYVVLATSRSLARQALTANPDDPLIRWWFSVNVAVGVALALFSGSRGNRWLRAKMENAGAVGLTVVAAKSKREALRAHRDGGGR